MKRIGVIDFDTSHVAAFVSRLNHVGVGEDQWVEGGQMVIGCPGKSIIFPERIKQETAAVQKLGLTLVDTPEEMLKHNLDAVFIESNSGLQHLERAKFFLERKIPLFIDKPFACSVADAEAMFELADKAGVPIFSSSSLRYAKEVVEFKQRKEAKNPTLGCLTYGPAPTHEKNPGLFHYGIHVVEMLYAIMGPGCEWLSNVSGPQCEVVTGYWKGDRVGSVRGTRPYSAYGFMAFLGDKAECHPVSTGVIYRDLLKEILAMLETGKAPVDPKETIEIVRFIELAGKSAANHGMPQYLV